MTPPKVLIITSVLLLLPSSVWLGVLHVHATRVRDDHKRLGPVAHRAPPERTPRAGGVAPDAADTRLREAQTRIANLEEELARECKENEDLQGKLRENDIKLALLAGHPEREAENATPAPTSSDDLRAQLEASRQELSAAEHDNALLSDEIKNVRKRLAQLETRSKKRPSGGGEPGIRGKVLAVNRAYNFVVLNLGSRQGVETDAEMLVLRDGSFLGKILISSVEPATAIGDIITSSLARGVQVQSGDIVIYAGKNF